MNIPLQQSESSLSTILPWAEVSCTVFMRHPTDLSAALDRFKALGVCFLKVTDDSPSDISGRIEWADQSILVPKGPTGEHDHDWFTDMLTKLFADHLCPNFVDPNTLKEALKSPDVLRPGADSDAIWHLKTAPPTVLKVGDPDVINLEIRFLEQVSNICDRVFPGIISHGPLSDKHGYLMDAGKPDTGDAAIFSDDIRLTLNDDWPTKLLEILGSLESLYKKTLVQRPSKVANYHYRERIARVLTRDDFRSTAIETRACADVAKILQKPLEINGQHMPSLASMVDTASHRTAQWQAQYSTMIHGDLHLKNIVKAEAKNRFMFLDPRLQWDN